MDNLVALAELLHERNRIDEHISTLIQRPATQGHIGEFIASKIFDIRLMASAANKVIDGHFTSGALAGRSVDVKFYGKQEGILDINANAQPDYFLVLTGPRAAAVSSRGTSRPCVVDHVYLFEGKALVDELRHQGAQVGIAASVRSRQWDAAEIYPVQTNKVLILTESQREMLSRFASKR